MGPGRCAYANSREAEVGHGSRHRAAVQGITRGDEDDGDAFALGFCEQRTIVERRRFAASGKPFGVYWDAGSAIASALRLMGICMVPACCAFKSQIPVASESSAS